MPDTYAQIIRRYADPVKHEQTRQKAWMRIAMVALNKADVMVLEKESLEEVRALCDLIEETIND